MVGAIISRTKTIADMICRERQTWRCSHCLVHGSAVWAVRDGPNGPRVKAKFALLLDLANYPLQSLCHNCGLVNERERRLPPWAKNLHIQDTILGPR
jgi:chromatin structure-remodeling complex subunit SFH1